MERVGAVRGRRGARLAATALRASWWLLLVALVGTGSLGAVTLGPALVLGVFLTACALVGLNAALVAHALDRDVGATVEPGLLAAAVVPVIAGSVELVGPWALVPWALLVLTARGSTTLWREHQQSRSREGRALTLRHVARTQPWRAAVADDALPLPQDPVRLTGCSTRQLLRLWQETSRELGLVGDPTTLDLVLTLRSACFDELERRHPDGVRAWLASGATEAPGRFVQGPASEEGSDPLP